MNLDFSAFEKAISQLEGKRLKIIIELEGKPTVTDQSFLAEIKQARKDFEAKVAEYQARLNG